MDKFEQRIQQAAEEVRQSTRLMTPPPSPSRVVSWGTRGLAFAGGVAVVVLGVALIPALFAEEQPPLGSEGITTVPTTIPEPDTSDSAPSPSTTTVPDAGVCSSHGVELPGPVSGLPPAVAETRDAIIDAAIACDFDALEQLAGPNFVTHHGDGGFDELERWEDEGEGKLGKLLLLLDMSNTRQLTEPFEQEPVTYYIWPGAFMFEQWEDIPQHNLDELLAIYTQEELDQMSGFGSYAGARTGITEQGEWVYYVIGGD